MKFFNQNKCKFCKKVFCCVECRTKHETSRHFELLQTANCCILCTGTKNEFTLNRENSNEFIDHLIKHHLPLQCQKCNVIFSNKEDFHLITCVKNYKNGEGDCELILPKMATSKDAKENDNKIDECVDEMNGESEKDDDLSPLMENEKNEPRKSFGRCKTFDGSLNSCSDMSSIHNSENVNKTESPVKKIIRQTSTPMLHNLKFDNKMMSSSSIQISNITSSSHEDHIGPSLPAGRISPKTPSYTNKRRPLPITPLRQEILSRSIRAYQKQKYTGTPPLDLRTSPVLRRTRSIDASYKIPSRPSQLIRNAEVKMSKEKREHNNTWQREFQQTHNKQNESTFYETCLTFEHQEYQETPKLGGNLKRSASCTEQNRNDDDDEWFTPNIFPQKSFPLTDRFQLSHQSIASTVNQASQMSVLQQGKSVLWSLMSSIFGGKASISELPEISEVPENDVNENEKPSLLKRCASFSGLLKLSDSSNDLNPEKRRRINTLSEANNDFTNSTPSGPRIRGRPPINRMRQS